MKLIRLAVMVALVFLLSSSGFCLRFSVVSDSQANFDNPLAEPKILARFLDDMSRQDPRPAFLLHGGDIITGWTSDPKVLQKQFSIYKEAVKKAPFPVHNAMGNHEGYDSQGIALYRKNIGPPYHSFSQDGWHFILLDNASAGHYKTLGPEQEAWLRKDLEESRGLKGTFITLHLPLAADDMEAWLEVDKEERDRLHALFLANNVKAVFQGHFHTYEMCIRDGIKYVICGGGGGVLEDWPPVSHFFHYLIVDADDGYLSITPRRLEDIEAEEKDRNAIRPKAVAVTPGTLLDGFEGEALSRWTVYNDLVRLALEGKAPTEGKQSLRMDFDFAVSLWPGLYCASSTPWDMAGARGISVDIKASPSLYSSKEEVVKVQLGLGKCKSPVRELKKGKWTTLKWEFSEAGWECGKKGKAQPLGKGELAEVSGLSLSVIAEPTVPRKDWERRMKGDILLDNLKVL